MGGFVLGLVTLKRSKFTSPFLILMQTIAARRNPYSNQAMLNSQRLMMSRMMMARRRRPTTPAPAMGQLNAAERQAMMMNQMLPLLLMQQQQPASQGTNQAVGVDPSAPGAQAAPG